MGTPTADMPPEQSDGPRRYPFGGALAEAGGTADLPPTSFWVPMPTALLIARAFESYLLVGFGFGAWFAVRGAGRLDPIAAGGSWGFRLLVFPAAVALWPYLAVRLARGGAAPPIEDTDHRRRARAHPPSQ